MCFHLESNSLNIQYRCVCVFFFSFQKDAQSHHNTIFALRISHNRLSIMVFVLFLFWCSFLFPLQRSFAFTLSDFLICLKYKLKHTPRCGVYTRQLMVKWVQKKIESENYHAVKGDRWYCCEGTAVVRRGEKVKEKLF